MANQAGSAFRLARLPLAIIIASTSTGLLASTSGDQLDTVIVTGNRGAQERTVTKSPTPIDVVTGEQLQALGKVGLLEALDKTVPSFNLAFSWGSSRIPTLRGLTAGHVLVLVNGKRRHAGATLETRGSNNSAAPIDLDLIPVAAIDRVEILRDGAAAQYGADAIAGVINIILKQDTGGSATTRLGRGYDGKRDTVQQTLNYGLEVGEAGVLNLSLDASRQDKANKAGSNRFAQLYHRLPDGSPDPREATANRHTLTSYGPPKSEVVNAAYNLDLPLGDELTLYSFSTLAVRENKNGSALTRANSESTITWGPNARPDGYSPDRLINETDFQAVFGVRGEPAQGWNWDLSSSWGSNQAKHRIHNSQNASLGAETPNKFTSATYISTQWTTNLDVKNAYELGLARPVDVAWGLEHRRDTYEVEAGSWASYADGGFTYPGGHPLATRPGVPGATGAAVVSPADEQKLDRDSLASYLDFGFYPTEQWFIGTALRYEYYNRGVGDSVSGKLSTRYEFNPSFALRGALGNGFRAPPLALSAYSSRTVTNGIIDNVYKSYNNAILPVNSAAARQLGAVDLDPERATNYSLGFAYTPTTNLSVTLDAYRIDLRDRLVLTKRYSGAGVRALLASVGYGDTDGAQFFTNGADTRTTGVDLVASYLQRGERLGRIKWTAALNRNQTKVRKVNSAPAALQGLAGGPLLDREAQAIITDSTPDTKLILSADWAVRDFDINLTLTRYGEVTEVFASSDPSLDRTSSAKWITDLDIGYNLNEKLNIGFGAQNLFDVYPDKGVPTTQAGQGYGVYSPFGFNGGFYYTRLTYDF